MKTASFQMANPVFDRAKAPSGGFWEANSDALPGREYRAKRRKREMIMAVNATSIHSNSLFYTVGIISTIFFLACRTCPIHLLFYRGAELTKLPAFGPDSTGLTADEFEEELMEAGHA